LKTKRLLNGVSIPAGISKRLSETLTTTWIWHALAKVCPSVLWDHFHQGIMFPNLIYPHHSSMHVNPVDICTKIIPSGMIWERLVGLILYDLNDSKSWCFPMIVYERFSFPLSLFD
jgi:hypothetical protein